jgi:hypothetical protein
MSVTVQLALAFVFTTESNSADVTCYIIITVVSVIFKIFVSVASIEINLIMK